MGLKPGQKAPASGQYGVVGPRGGKINKENLKLNIENQLSHLERDGFAF